MTTLATEYLGLALRSPIVASAGPYTGDLERLRQLADAGVGAVVLPSLFQEEIEHDAAEIDRLFSVHAESFVEAASFFPDLHGVGDPVDAYLRHLEAARAAIDVPVIASLNGTNLGGWIRYGRLLADAGAHAIELNLYEIAAEAAVDGRTIESEQLELVHTLVAELAIPVAVKISPAYTSVAAFALALQEAGAGGLVLFNRFYLPDVDLEMMEVAPHLTLSTSHDLRLPLRWIGILRDQLRISLAASSGVHTGEDVAKLLLVGADVAMTTSAVLRHGPEYIGRLEEELVEWMAGHDYHDVAEMRGAMSQDATPDPAAFERANYIGNLATYTSRFLGRRAPSAGPGLIRS